MKEFYKNKKVLITGHTGFKGAWLGQLLCELGASVTGVALRPHTKPNLFKSIKLKYRVKTYFADICDYQKLDRIFKK